MPEKYWYKTIGLEPDVTCVEPCNINKGNMIGSVNCQKCKFNIDRIEEFDFDNIYELPYVRCKIIQQALGKE